MWRNKLERLTQISFIGIAEWGTLQSNAKSEPIKEHAAREQVVREQVAREQVAREQSAREKDPREQGARLSHYSHFLDIQHNNKNATLSMTTLRMPKLSVAVKSKLMNVVALDTSVKASELSLSKRQRRKTTDL